MSDLEHLFADALKKSQQPPDESFVSKVTQNIDAYESARTVRLCALTVLALYLAGTLGCGMYLSWNAAHAASLSGLPASPTVLSVSSLVLVAIASLVLRPRTRSRE